MNGVVGCSFRILNIFRFLFVVGLGVVSSLFFVKIDLVFVIKYSVCFFLVIDKWLVERCIVDFGIIIWVVVIMCIIF